MHEELRIANRAEAMTPTRKRIRELAERTSNGTRMRLFWLQGTRELWVEVCEPEFDHAIVIPAEPERALETFHHPYAYATADSVVPLTAETLEGNRE
jgi:hypothetical protein